MKPSKNYDDIAYSEETRELLIKTYKTEIQGLVESSMELISEHHTKNGISEREFFKCIRASLTGAFIIGFKHGNDLFMDDAEKETQKK